MKWLVCFILFMLFITLTSDSCITKTYCQYNIGREIKK